MGSRAAFGKQADNHFSFWGEYVSESEVPAYLNQQSQSSKSQNGKEQMQIVLQSYGKLARKMPRPAYSRTATIWQRARTVSASELRKLSRVVNDESWLGE